MSVAIFSVKIASPQSAILTPPPRETVPLRHCSSATIAPPSPSFLRANALSNPISSSIDNLTSSSTTTSSLDPSPPPLISSPPSRSSSPAATSSSTGPSPPPSASSPPFRSSAPAVTTTFTGSTLEDPNSNCIVLLTGIISADLGHCSPLQDLYLYENKRAAGWAAGEQRFFAPNKSEQLDSHQTDVINWE